MSNVYRIGVNIAMASNGPQVLAALSRHLLGVHTQTNQLTGAMNRLKLAIGGAFAVGAGVAILAAFKGPLDEARKLEMAVGRFSRFGLGPERTKEAENFAKSMNIAGSTYVSNMNRMIEAQGVFRESGLKGEAALRGAKMAAPTLAKIDFANSALDEETKAKFHTQNLAMLRFIELRGGVNSPEKFNAIANQGFKAITSSGGNVSWEQLRQFVTVGGVSTQNLRDDVLFGKLEPIIGELKGGGAGNALMTSYGRLSGAQRLPNQIAHALVDMGIWDGSKIEWNSQGGVKRIKGGVGGLPGNPMRDLAGFSADPFAWYDANIRAVYEKQKLSPEERSRNNFAIFGRQGAKLFNVYERQHEAVNNSVEAQRKAMGIDQAYGAAGGTLNGKIVDLHAKWTNLMERLGEAVLPMAVKGLEILVPAIANLTKWVSEHQGAVRLFAKTAVVIAAALIALGTVAVGAAAGLAIFAGGTVGIAVAGIATVTAAVGALIALNWTSLGTALYKIAHPLETLRKEASTVGPDGRHHTAFGDALMVDDFNKRKSRAPTHPAANSNQHGGGVVVMDGKKVGAIVSGHQAAAMGPGMAHAGRFDPSTGAPNAGAAVRR